jgi:hypothetical protein
MDTIQVQVVPLGEYHAWYIITSEMDEEFISDSTTTCLRFDAALTEGEMSEPLKHANEPATAIARQTLGNDFKDFRTEEVLFYSKSFIVERSARASKGESRSIVRSALEEAFDTSVELILQGMREPAYA